MPPEDETAKHTYDQITDLIGKLNGEASIDGRLIKIESTYKTGDQINKLIWAAIDKNDQNNNKNKINWNVIVQGVMIAVISAAMMYFYSGGGN